jgi:hypothetical protein
LVSSGTGERSCHADQDLGPGCSAWHRHQNDGGPETPQNSSHGEPPAPWGISIAGVSALTGKGNGSLEVGLILQAAIVV